MGNGHAGLFLLVLVRAVVSARSNLCPFDGDWQYHNTTGTCMSLFTTKQSYVKAINVCQNFTGGGDRTIPGDLVFIFDKNTDNFVKALIRTNKIDTAWIGLNNRGSDINEFRWGENRQQFILGPYTGWTTYQPNYTAKNYVVISVDGWKCVPLGFKAEFVCQVKAVMPLPTISGPPAEVGRASSITCTINVTTDQATITELRFNRSGQVVASCTRNGCNKNNTLDVSLIPGTASWTSILKIMKVQRKDEGNWSCSVEFSNGQETTSNQLNLNVYSVPSNVACEASYLQDTITVSCTTDRMYPEAVCKWNSIKDTISELPTHQSSNSIQTYDSNGEIFYQTTCNGSVTKPTAGKYLFTVAVYPLVPGLDVSQTSTVKTGSLSVDLMPPNNPPVWFVSERENPISSHLDVTVNQTITITCLITGGNPGVYSLTTKCFSQPQKETSGSVASVNIITTQEFHGQSCSCVGKHLTGTTNVTYVTFLVKSSPRIISFNISRKQLNRDVEENDQVYLACDATGYPEYQLSLVHDQDWNHPLNMTSSTANYSEVDYYLNAACPTGRRYTCLAKNNDGQTDMRQSRLRVRCAPTYCPNMIHKYGIPMGVNKTLTMCVNVYPAPTSYLLYKDTVKDENKINMSKYSANFGYTDSDADQGVITVTINEVDQNDFGVYVLCSFVKQMNHSELQPKLEFELLPRGPPICPENLKMSSTVSDTITLSWTSSFDGGLQQSFTILRYDSGLTTEPQNVSVIVQPVGSVQLAMSYNVTGLSERTTYTFGLRVENAEGVSNCTLQVQGSTKASSSPGDWNKTVLVVSAVFILFLVIISVVVVVIVLVRRRRSRVFTAQAETKDDVSKGSSAELNQENTYNQVNNQNKKKDKKKKRRKCEKSSEAAMYSNLSNYVEMKPVHAVAADSSVYANATSSSKTGKEKLAPMRDDGRTVTADGLIYAEVVINVNTTNPVIKDQVKSKIAKAPPKPVEPSVEYVSIDFAASAKLKTGDQ